MNVKLNDLIARETHGRSYQSMRYSLDDLDSLSSADSDDSSSSRVWERPAELNQRSRYINLEHIAKRLADSDSQILTYFLDGSRRIFRVDETAYAFSGGRRVLYPVLAGQVITGCCRRVNRKLTPEKLTREIVISLPEIADYDNNAHRGFWQGLAQKFSAGLSGTGLEISSPVLSYKTGADPRNTSFEDRATAAIQTKMLSSERELTEHLARRNLLGPENYLIKDGSLEYRKKSGISIQNYRWVIGLSKSFNPSACFTQGKEDSGYIADLPVNHRTQAACYSSGMLGDVKLAVWYIRLHDRKHTRSAFDGVVKAEKILVTQSERETGTLDSEEINTLSAYILNERYPVCRGSDSRWANHIYPVYLTEQYIKSKYLSTESFLHLF